MNALTIPGRLRTTAAFLTSPASDMDARVDRANGWTHAARPALHALSEMYGMPYFGDVEDKCAEATEDALSRARQMLFAIATDARERAIHDAQPEVPAGDDEAAWSAYAEACADLDHRVTRVSAAIARAGKGAQA